MDDISQYVTVVQLVDCPSFDDVYAEVSDTLAHRDIVVAGRTVEEPRLTAWFSDERKSYSYNNVVLPTYGLGPMLSMIKGQLDGVDNKFNSCLVNLYRDGRDSIGWHADDEPELGVDPVIASVSLGATRTFKLKERATGKVYKFGVGHGTVVWMHGKCQRLFVHCVPKEPGIVDPRMNLTFRRIA